MRRGSIRREYRQTAPFRPLTENIPGKIEPSTIPMLVVVWQDIHSALKLESTGLEQPAPDLDPACSQGLQGCCKRTAAIREGFPLVIWSCRILLSAEMMYHALLINVTIVVYTVKRLADVEKLPEKILEARFAMRYPDIEGLQAVWYLPALSEIALRERWRKVCPLFGGSQFSTRGRSSYEYSRKPTYPPQIRADKKDSRPTLR